MGLVVVLGGARSGKSAFALEVVSRLSRPMTFLATAEARDEEMAARIAAHRAERRVDATTIEEPLALDEAIGAVEEGEGLVVDCLTLWVSNVMAVGNSDEEVLTRARAAAATASSRGGLTVVVSNEVGSGIVPTDALSRRYRDLLGRVNTVFVSRAEEAYLLVAGRALPLVELGSLPLSAARR
jgi:adenosyl cobinamide kinase/adenosyl cobinamide phosphate guanylyltransferase